MNPILPMVHGTIQPSLGGRLASKSPSPLPPDVSTSQSPPQSPSSTLGFSFFNVENENEAHQVQTPNLSQAKDVVSREVLEGFKEKYQYNSRNPNLSELYTYFKEDLKKYHIDHKTELFFTQFWRNPNNLNHKIIEINKNFHAHIIDDLISFNFPFQNLSSTTLTDTFIAIYVFWLNLLSPSIKKKALEYINPAHFRVLIGIKNLENKIKTLENDKKSNSDALNIGELRSQLKIHKDKAKVFNKIFIMLDCFNYSYEIDCPEKNHISHTSPFSLFMTENEHSVSLARQVSDILTRSRYNEDDIKKFINALSCHKLADEVKNGSIVVKGEAKIKKMLDLSSTNRFSKDEYAFINSCSNWEMAVKQNANLEKLKKIESIYCDLRDLRKNEPECYKEARVENFVLTYMPYFPFYLIKEYHATVPHPKSPVNKKIAELIAIKELELLHLSKKERDNELFQCIIVKNNEPKNPEDLYTIIRVMDLKFLNEAGADYDNFWVLEPSVASNPSEMKVASKIITLDTYNKLALPKHLQNILKSVIIFANPIAQQIGTFLIDELQPVFEWNKKDLSKIEVDDFKEIIFQVVSNPNYSLPLNLEFKLNVGAIFDNDKVRYLFGALSEYLHNSVGIKSRPNGISELSMEGEDKQEQLFNNLTKIFKKQELPESLKEFAREINGIQDALDKTIEQLLSPELIKQYKFTFVGKGKLILYAILGHTFISMSSTYFFGHHNKAEGINTSVLLFRLLGTICMTKYLEDNENETFKTNLIESNLKTIVLSCLLTDECAEEISTCHLYAKKLEVLKRIIVNRPLPFH